MGPPLLSPPPFWDLCKSCCSTAAAAAAKDRGAGGRAVVDPGGGAVGTNCEVTLRPPFEAARLRATLETLGGAPAAVVLISGGVGGA